jgi:fused signal recognition particle receptor
MSEEKKGFFNRLKSGLTKTRDNIVAGIDAVFYGASEIDEDFYEELEEILIMGDIGVNATNDIIERMKEEVKKRHLRLPSECKELLVESIKEQMRVGDTAYDFEKKQSVIFIIGVNGVGKTTSVGKLAGILKGQGRKVLIAAADTFRAAAGDQLSEWANRAGVDMIGGNEGADPASVIYDAVNAAKARNVDVLICDTAGRLHNKKNLMEELKKMNRIIDREFPNAYRENLIVLDGTTGQNALSQAREFGEVANLTGVILTKMDGTAKGGIAVAIQSELNVPVKYIGVGETIDDLQKFNADEFVDALFDIKREDSEVEAMAVETSEVECDSLDNEIETMTDETATACETDVESSGTDVEDMSNTETQSAEISENVLPNEAPEIKFSWGDEEEEQTEEQPKKKKWGFWK